VGDWDLPQPQRDRLTNASAFQHGYPKEWMDISFPGTFGEEEFPPRYAQRLP
jgi:hypothetical protein